MNLGMKLVELYVGTTGSENAKHLIRIPVLIRHHQIQYNYIELDQSFEATFRSNQFLVDTYSDSCHIQHAHPRAELADGLYIYTKTFVLRLDYLHYNSIS